MPTKYDENMMKPKIKMVDTKEYLSVLRDIVSEGHEVTINIAGNSMSPFLRDKRDRITFKTPDKELKKGDIVLFQRKSGEFVCHRIVSIGEEGYYIVGDAQTYIEGPVEREQIFAIVTSVVRNGKKLGPKSLVWKYHAFIRPKLVRVRNKFA